ncbi:MAG: T9SS type A sorting domain-containing protein, partial [Ignavibacteriaceae bacterium]
LTSFTAVSQLGKVILNWSTATEINNLGFEIQRRVINNETNGDWSLIGFREGYGTTTEPQEYSYTDDISKVKAASIFYRLKQIDYNGSYEYSDEVFVDNPAPLDFALQQNYPNPFNPTTKITFGIPLKSNVVLKVFNSVGEEVTQLVNEEKSAGSYEVTFNAKNLPSGVYFYQLKTADFIKIKKMVFLK